MSAPCSFGTEEVRCRQRIVDDERNAGFLGNCRNGRDVDHEPAGVGNALDEDRPGLVGESRRDRVRVRRVGPHDVPVRLLEGVVELVDGAAVQLAAGDELVARLEQRVKDEVLGGVPRGDGERRGAAFERGNAGFEDRLRRIGDAGVDVAERLEAEQRRGVVGIIEDEGCRLVDGRDARAGRRVGRGSGMYCERGKSRRRGRLAVGHDPLSLMCLAGGAIGRAASRKSTAENG